MAQADQRENQGQNLLTPNSPVIPPENGETGNLHSHSASLGNSIGGYSLRKSNSSGEWPDACFYLEKNELVRKAFWVINTAYYGETKKARCVKIEERVKVWVLKFNLGKRKTTHIVLDRWGGVTSIRNRGLPHLG